MKIQNGDVIIVENGELKKMLVGSVYKSKDVYIYQDKQLQNINKISKLKREIACVNRRKQ